MVKKTVQPSNIGKHLVFDNGTGTYKVKGSTPANIDKLYAENTSLVSDDELLPTNELRKILTVNNGNTIIGHSYNSGMGKFTSLSDQRPLKTSLFVASTYASYGYKDIPVENLAKQNTANGVYIRSSNVFPVLNHLGVGAVNIGILSSERPAGINNVCIGTWTNGGNYNTIIGGLRVLPYLKLDTLVTNKNDLVPLTGLQQVSGSRFLIEKQLGDSEIASIVSDYVYRADSYYAAVEVIKLTRTNGSISADSLGAVMVNKRLYINERDTFKLLTSGQDTSISPDQLSGMQLMPNEGRSVYYAVKLSTFYNNTAIGKNEYAALPSKLKNTFLVDHQHTVMKGDLTVDGAVNSSSDSRLKYDVQVIKTLRSGVELVKFKRLATGNTEIGYIAQQVEQVLANRGYDAETISMVVKRSSGTDWQSTIANINAVSDVQIENFTQAQDARYTTLQNLANSLGITEPTFNEFVHAVEAIDDDQLTEWQRNTYKALTEHPLYNMEALITFTNDIRTIDKQLLNDLLEG